MTLFSRHVTDRLSAHVHGQLNDRQARHVARHLSHCEHCRAHLDDMAFGIESLNELQIAQAPEAVWSAIEAGLGRPSPARRLRLAVLLAAAAMLGAIGYWVAPREPAAHWNLVRIQGAAQRTGRVSPGEWIRTDASTKAVVTVGSIGTVEVSPNTSLRVVAERPGENRLALRRGEIHATISAPPRLFFVDTAAGTAVDLGCEYTLRTDEDGSGILQVTRGWVEFRWKAVESLVPGGASCRTTPEGPGIPYFEDAPESLKHALDAGDQALDLALAAARVRDTLSLWHLLWRVGSAERERVYDRMATLAPVPAGVTRDMVLKLDPATLARWKDELAWTW